MIHALTATPRRAWWLSFVVLFALMTAWNLATPRFGAPDEPAHVVRATSVVRGQLLGREANGDDRVPQGTRFVDVPRSIADGARVGCFAFQPGATADCLDLSRSSDEVEAPTTAGRHPPLYYAIVGAPSLVVPDARAVWLMRLMTTAIVAAFLASALASARRARVPTLAAAGLAVAVTPMVLFVGGTVSPSGPEIAAAICLWTTGLALLDADFIPARLATRAGVAAIVLALARQLGPMFLVLVLAALVGIGGRRALDLARDRAVRLWVILTGSAVVLQGLWVLLAKPLDSSTGAATTNTHYTGIELTKLSFGRGGILLREMIGVFGWRDTAAPEATYLIWIAALGAVVVLGVVLGARRDLLVVGALLVLSIVIPVISEAREANTVDFFWQGRYTLPLAVGIPIVATWSAARRTEPALDLARLGLVLGVALGLAQGLAFLQAERRYSVGAQGELAFWRHAHWTPPGGVGPVTAVFLAAVVTWYICLFADQSRAVEDAVPTGSIS